MQGDSEEPDPSCNDLCTVNKAEILVVDPGSCWISYHNLTYRKRYRTAFASGRLSSADRCSTVVIIEFPGSSKYNVQRYEVLSLSAPNIEVLAILNLGARAEITIEKLLSKGPKAARRVSNICIVDFSDSRDEFENQRLWWRRVSHHRYVGHH
jgi:hypothetical protein